MYIPEDCIVSILNWCDVKSSISLSLTCQFYTHIYQKIVKNNCKFYGKNLKYKQYLAVQQLYDKSKLYKELVLCCPMGYGKTMTTLYYIFNIIKNDRVFIMTPPTVLKTWIDEINKLNLYHSDPKKSQILVISSNYKNHYECYHGNMFMTHRVTLGTVNTKPKEKVDTVIMDEGHHNYHVNFEYKQLIKLTAEKGKGGANYIYSNFGKAEKIPKIKFHFNIINGHNNLSIYKNHITQFNENLVAFLNELSKIVSLYDKTCIFVDNGDIGNYIEEFLNNYMNNYKVFKLKSSLQTYNKHMVYKGKSILLLSTMTNEGLNLLVDNIIIVKPDIYNTTRLKQTFGRVLRPNNPNKNVNVHLLTNGKLGMLKCLYAIAYSNKDWNFPYSDSPSPMLLLKSETILKLVGYKNITDYHLGDYCIIFDGDTHLNQEEKIAWWLDNNKNSKLTLDTLNLIYN